MQLLKKTWIRVLASLFGGGMITELIHISTGDPNRTRTDTFTLLYALIVYGVLSLVVKGADNKMR
jgi:hypothetical protein